MGEAYPICNDFFETLCERLGRYLPIYLDSDVLLERLCERECIELNIWIAVGQSFKNGCNDIVSPVDGFC